MVLAGQTTSPEAIGKEGGTGNTRDTMLTDGHEMDFAHNARETHRRWTNIIPVLWKFTEYVLFPAWLYTDLSIYLSITAPQKIAPMVDL